MAKSLGDEYRPAVLNGEGKLAFILFCCWFLFLGGRFGVNRDLSCDIRIKLGDTRREVLHACWDDTTL